MSSFIRWMSAPELRLAGRVLRAQPIVTLTTVLALAVGIGMATTGFALVDAVLFSKLPFPNGDRFVLLEAYAEPEGSRTSLDAGRFRFLAGRASTLEHLGAFRGAEVNLLLDSDQLVPIRGAFVTPDSIRVFPYAPILGRMLHAEDAVRGAPPVVLLRESLWRRHLSADSRVVGAVATVSGVKRTVVGVMPDEFRFPNSGELWLPLDDAVAATTWGMGRTFAVLTRGSEPAAAGAQVAALSTQFEAETPAAPRLRIAVIRFTDALSRGLELLAGVFVACLVLVLVVISANIANLVLARSFARSRELAVRTALGATRARLVGQIFIEVLLLGAIAAAIGLTASQAVLLWIKRTLTDMPFWVDYTANPRTMLFVACATLLAAGIGGVIPALKATRGNTADTLAATTRGASTGFGTIGALMVGAQVALSIALMNAALVMARGVGGYMSPAVLVPPGEVLTARVLSEDASRTAIVDALAAIPGVVAAGASTSLPGLSPPARMTAVEASAGEPAAVTRAAPVVAVHGGFFETLGARVEAGRLFTAADFAASAPPVAVVNAPFVAVFLGGANPIGRRVRTIPAEAGATPEPWREIVGVVPDLGLSAGDPSMAAGFYVPMGREAVFHVALRSSGDARRLAGPLRAAVSRIDPDAQLRDVVALPDVGREDRVVFAGIGTALGALGAMALLLSVVGTYAILSLSVTRLTREIGLRTALGVSRGRVLRSIMGRTCLPPAIGAVAGIALGEALVAARGIFAFRLPDGSGPWGLPLLGAILIAAGLLSAWVPARRALAIAPAEALRTE
jgi:putative ABC transport system permease protein